MTDDEQVKQALAELGDVVRCRCHEAYRDRGLQDPQCQCDSADAVKVVTARIEALERERERLGREVNMARYGQPDFSWSVHKEAMADLEARLDKAVVALREASSFLWHMTNAIDDEDYKGPHDGFNVPLVCHVQPYHDLHVEQLKTQAKNVDATLTEIAPYGLEGGKKDE